MNRFLAAAVATLAATGAGAGTINGAYTFTVIDAQRALARVHAKNVAIREDGTVVYARGQANGARDLAAVSPDGTLSLRPTGGLEPGALPEQFLSVNRAGQTAVVTSSQTVRALSVIDPDGTARQLLSVDGLDVAAAPVGAIVGIDSIELADNGDIALTAAVKRAPDATSSATTEVALFHVGQTGTDAPVFTKLDTDVGGVGGSSFINRLGIDPDGRVGWIAQVDNATPDAASELRLFDPADGSVRTVVRTDAGVDQLGLGAALNGAVQFAAGRNPSFNEVVSGALDDARPETFDVKAAGTVRAFDINDFGQVARIGEFSRNIVLDNTVVLADGAVIDGYRISGARLSWGSSINGNHGEFLNDAGQFAFGFIATTDGTLDTETIIVVRADPVGATLDTAVVPTTQDGPVSTLDYQIVNGLGLDRPIFVDPVVMTEFDYEILGGPLITSLMIPFQDLGAEDGLFDISFGGYSRTIGWDETLDFTAFAGFENGLSAFTIAGIDPGSAVRSDDPFVVGLTHASLGAVDLRITGRDVADVAPIPLPAGGWLLLSGLLALGARRGAHRR